MFRRFGLSLVALSAVLGSTLPAFAQSTCAPEKLAAAVDVYAQEPFGARAWRKLNGLGDAGIESSGGYSDWQARESWQKKVAELAPDLVEAQQLGYDCRIGYPLEVLEQRVKDFGAADPYIKQWLRAQAVVFKSCNDAGGAQLALAAPLEVKPEHAALQNFDRLYQQASIDFYRDKAKAAEAFRAIAASPSPHKAAARYNIANLMANGRDVVGARKEAQAILADAALASVHDITRELLGYIANLEDTAQGWSALLDTTVATLSQPDAKVLATEKSKAAFGEALYDISYAGVTAKRDDWWVTNTLPADATLSKSLADAARKHPMVLWMMTGQTIAAPDNVVAWPLTGEKWQSWAGSFVDRALALQPANSIAPLPRSLIENLKAKPDDATRAKLWQAAKDAASKAQASCGDAPESAAVVLLANQASKLSVLANRYDEIYAALPVLKSVMPKAYDDVLLPQLMAAVLTTGNAEEGRRLRDALLGELEIAALMLPENEVRRRTVSDFLARVAEDEPTWLKAVQLHPEPLHDMLLNLLPAKKLREFSENTGFNAEQRALLARAAWTRNYARGLRNSAATTAAMLALNPEIQTALEGIKKEFPKLKADRALLLTILRNPRFGILISSPDWSDAIETKRTDFAALDSFDGNDKNWWCPLETDRVLQAMRLRFDEDNKMVFVKGGYKAELLNPVLASDAISTADAAREVFLKDHAMVKSIDWAEVAALAKAPSAPKLMTVAALRWAKGGAATDDAAAEALARAIGATRYGCRWHGGHKAYSKPAQELLKAKFPANTWTARTPYWFDCMDATWDAQGNKVPNCVPRTWPQQELLK